MRWLSANWIGIVVVGGMLWMHLGMHRGHGGHGRSPEPEEQQTSAGHESHHMDDPATRTTGVAPGGSERHRGC
jgi:hypothetical protein